MEEPNLPMRKQTIRLFEEDLEALRKFYPQSGYNIAIRTLVHRHVVRLQNRVAAVETSEVPRIEEERLDLE